MRILVSDRRRFLQSASAAVLGLAANLSRTARLAASEEGDILYNGVRLPPQWPPRLDRLSREPLASISPPHLPPVIPIDVGRQLLVDDFLVEHTTLERKFHTATFHPASPVIEPEARNKWEKTGELPTAIPFSDGVWYDPRDERFRLWYRAGFAPSTTCYAESQDGINWSKPALDVRPGTNIVQADDRDSSTVWLDLSDPDPRRRYKLALVPVVDEKTGAKPCLNLHFSADGIHWSGVAARSGPCGDRTTVFYNPFRKVWVYSLRAYSKEVGRCRKYWENPDFLAGASWTKDRPVPWVGADKLDLPDPGEPNAHCQLYNLDAVAYESILLGCFSIMRGRKRKGNDLALGYSRDGFYWNRPDRRAFIATSRRRGEWNYDYLQSAGGCCLIVGDQLHFYVSGRSDDYTRPDAQRSTGLAVLRRDGFASLRAGDAGGTLTTRAVRFHGKYLFVNAAAEAGELRAEVLDPQGRVIAPFTLERCVPVRVDRTLAQVTWQGATALTRLRGKPVRFRFTLRNAALYAFWVSPQASGASHGYVAAGGPGFTGPTDTVGAGAYKGFE